MTIAGIIADTMLAALTVAVVVDATITSKWLRRSRIELEQIRRAAADIASGQPFELPTHCFSCGAYLMGSLTRHRAGCGIRKLIDQTFPGGSQT